MTSSTDSLGTSGSGLLRIFVNSVKEDVYALAALITCLGEPCGVLPITRDTWNGGMSQDEVEFALALDHEANPEFIPLDNFSEESEPETSTPKISKRQARLRKALEEGAGGAEEMARILMEGPSSESSDNDFPLELDALNDPKPSAQSALSPPSMLLAVLFSRFVQLVRSASTAIFSSEAKYRIHGVALREGRTEAYISCVGFLSQITHDCSEKLFYRYISCLNWANAQLSDSPAFNPFVLDDVLAICGKSETLLAKRARRAFSHVHAAWRKELPSSASGFSPRSVNLGGSRVNASGRPMEAHLAHSTQRSDLSVTKTVSGYLHLDDLQRSGVSGVVPLPGDLKDSQGHLLDDNTLGGATTFSDVPSDVPLTQFIRAQFAALRTELAALGVSDKLASVLPNDEEVEALAQAQDLRALEASRRLVQELRVRQENAVMNAPSGEALGALREHPDFSAAPTLPGDSRPSQPQSEEFLAPEEPPEESKPPPEQPDEPVDGQSSSASAADDRGEDAQRSSSVPAVSPTIDPELQAARSRIEELEEEVHQKDLSLSRITEENEALKLKAKKYKEKMKEAVRSTYSQLLANVSQASQSMMATRPLAEEVFQPSGNESFLGMVTTRTFGQSGQLSLTGTFQGVGEAGGAEPGEGSDQEQDAFGNDNAIVSETLEIDAADGTEVEAAPGPDTGSQ